RAQPATLIQGRADARAVDRESLQTRRRLFDLQLQQLELGHSVAGKNRLFVELRNLRFEFRKLGAEAIEVGLVFGSARDLLRPAFFQPTLIGQLGLAGLEAFFGSSFQFVVVPQLENLRQDALAL